MKPSGGSVMKPLGKRVLIRVIECPREEVRGGIIVPEKANRSTYREGIVQAVGPDYDGSLALGSKVMLPPYDGIELKINNETLIVIDEDKIPATLE